MTNKPQRECACGGKLNGEPDETHSLSVCGANPRPCICGHVESGHNTKGCKHCPCKRFDKSKPQREEIEKAANKAIKDFAPVFKSLEDHDKGKDIDTSRVEKALAREDWRETLRKSVFIRPQSLEDAEKEWQKAERLVRRVIVAKREEALRTNDRQWTLLLRDVKEKEKRMAVNRIKEIIKEMKEELEKIMTTESGIKEEFHFIPAAKVTVLDDLLNNLNK